MAGAPSAYTCALDVKLRTTPRMGMAPRVREVCIMVMDGVVCESNFQALQVGVQDSAAAASSRSKRFFRFGRGT